jgi:UDPglucose 6-dehydrogenase
MKIGVIGIGNVGMAVAIGLKNKGHKIICYDTDKIKLKLAKEAGLKVTYTLKKCIKSSKIIFVCVPTPSKPSGECNTTIVENVIKSINSLTSDKEEKIIVIKSTVIPGTCKKIRESIKSNLKLVYNPEFLRHEHALQDFLHPYRTIIGSDDKEAIEKVSKIFRGWGNPIIKVDFTSAEMIKYASNCFLATKVSFSNEIKNICEKLGVDAKKIIDAVALDKRINPSHLDPTKGPFGGPCLPKDLDALIFLSKKMGYKPLLLESVKKVNELVKRKIRSSNKIK